MSGVESTRVSELLGEVLELGGCGQGTEPEQVGGLLKGRLLGQLVDVDAAVGEHTSFAVDPADAGVLPRQFLRVP